MSWNSGSCEGGPDEERPARHIWPGATHYPGIVDRINPGHFPGLTAGGTVDETDERDEESDER